MNVVDGLFWLQGDLRNKDDLDKLFSSQKYVRVHLMIFFKKNSFFFHDLY